MAAQEYAGMTGAARLADDTRRRFLAEIAARVPLDRLVEVHLFTPIRQGGIETGVAIVAARRVEPDPVAATEPVAAPLDASMLPESSPGAIDAVPPDVPLAEPTDVVAVDAAADSVIVDDTSVPEVPNEEPLSETPDDGAAVVVESAEAPSVDAAACDPTDDAAGPVAASSTQEIADAADAPDDDVEEALADALADASGDALADALDDALLEDAPLDDVPPSPVRHTVFTARYRYTIKGPDRGRWDADVVEEADAPLVTVDAVVRGVQRRAGDAAEADRLDAEAVTRLLGGPPFTR